MKLIELLLERTSYEDMVKRLQSAYILMARGDMEGEKSAAKSAYDRLLTAIRRDYGDDQAASAEARVKGKGQSGDTSGPSYRYTRRPESKPKQKRKPSSSGSTHGGQGDGQSHIYADSRTGWTFYVLRFTDPAAGKRGSDKVWGYATKNGQVVSFWGAFGKNVQTKILSSEQEASTALGKKMKKGYNKTNVAFSPASYAFIFTQFN